MNLENKIDPKYLKPVILGSIITFIPYFLLDLLGGFLFDLGISIGKKSIFMFIGVILIKYNFVIGLFIGLFIVLTIFRKKDYFLSYISKLFFSLAIFVILSIIDSLIYKRFIFQVKFMDIVLFSALICIIVPLLRKHAQSTEQKTSLLAILSVIFGIIIPLIGIVLGIIALIRLNRNPHLSGKGLAIAGLIISLLSIFFIAPVIWGGLLSYFSSEGPGEFLPSHCALEGGISCVDWRTEPDQVRLSLHNNLGYSVDPVIIKIVHCIGEGRGSILNGQNQIFTIADCKFPYDSGRTFTVNFDVNFTNVETNEQGIISGILRDKVVDYSKI